MNKVLKTALILIVVATAPIANAMNYQANQSDILLLFRGTSGSVYTEVDLGSVTNLLNLAPNATSTFSGTYIPNQVKTNYGNSYNNVIFAVVGTTATGQTQTAWMTDFSDTSAPANLGSSYGAVHSAMTGSQGFGQLASTWTGFVASSNFVSNANSANYTFYYVLVTQPGNPSYTISQFGGDVGFTDEAAAGSTVNFYQFSSSATGPATLIGTFNMSSSTGVITFTRANSAAVTLVPSKIVGVLRAGNNTQVSFTTTNGNHYQLLYKTNAAQVGWITNSAAGTISGNNATNNLQDSTTDLQRYYGIQSF